MANFFDFRFFYVFLRTGKPPDFIAFGITLIMTSVLAMGASKSVIFNHTLNAINLATWVFVMAAGLFYVDTKTWSEHQGFLPYGWSGVSAHRIPFLSLSLSLPLSLYACINCIAGVLWRRDLFLCIYWFRYYRNHRRGGAQSAEEHTQGDCWIPHCCPHCLRER